MTLPESPSPEEIAYEQAWVGALIGPIATAVAAALASAGVGIAAGVGSALLAQALAARLRRISWTPLDGRIYEVAADAALRGVRTSVPPGVRPEDVPVSMPDRLPELDAPLRTRLDEAADMADKLPDMGRTELDKVAGRARSGVARAQGSVRWTVNDGINSGTADVARHMGQRTIWVAERNACLHCLAYAGWSTEPDGEFPPGLSFDPKGGIRPYGPLLWPPLHPNCFPAGSIVSGPGVRATFKRWYEGDMVEIRTGSGRILSGTPNHPVLTDQGWVPLGLLHEGSHVVGNGSLDRMLASDPHDYQEPTRIEDVARSLRRTSGVPVVSVPVSAEDFHGDGSNGNVHVVRADSALRDRGEIAEPFGHEQFGRRGAKLPILTGQSTARKSLDRIALSTSGIVSGGREPEPFGRVGAGHACEHRGGSVAQLHTGATQEPSEGVSADLALIRESLNALSGLVTLDQVVGIRRYPFAGHVYNLETSGGWYICNGITVHNCRCRIDLYDGPAGPPDPDRSKVDESARLAAEARRSVVYQWSDYASKTAGERAASALLDAGAGLADSVEKRARAALRSGRAVRRPG